jgi:hypothetical protein
MAVTHYDVGDIAVLDASFGVDDTPTDPAHVSFDVREPDGTVTTYTLGAGPAVGHPGVGLFTCEVPVTAAGYWRYRSTGDAPAPGAAAGIFVGDPNPFETGYEQAIRRRLCTLEEVKDYADEDLTDTSRDVIWERLVDDCADAFYRYTRREFTPSDDNPFERIFDLGEYEMAERQVDVGDLASTDGLSVKVELYDGTPIVTSASDGTVPAGSIIALPRNRDAWQPITELAFPLRDVTAPAQLRRGAVLLVAGDWGFPAVPGDVRQWAVEQVVIWFERDVAKFAGTWSLNEMHALHPRALDDSIRDGLDQYRMLSVG